MLECFLLLRQSGARWIPLLAIPAVLAGSLASICLMLSGIKGIITEWYRPKRRVARAASPERLVKWFGKPPQLRNAGQQWGKQRYTKRCAWRILSPCTSGTLPPGC